MFVLIACLIICQSLHTFFIAAGRMADGDAYDDYFLDYKA
uniref:Hypotheticial protein n=1 Tax=Angiostrongylus cantonensis TaxID=6313 RepID=A0A0K0DAP3_ANGCA